MRLFLLILASLATSVLGGIIGEASHGKRMPTKQKIAFATHLQDVEHLYYPKDTVNMHLRFHNEKNGILSRIIGKTNVLELPCSDDSLKVYILAAAGKEGQGTILDARFIGDAVEALRAPGAEEDNTHITTVYLPLWSQANRKSMMAKALKMTFDIDSLFSHAGFGDLAKGFGEANTDYSEKLTSSIQHLEILSLHNLPTMDDAIMIDDKEDHLIIACPYSLVVWDSLRKLPVYYGSIRSCEQNTQEADSKNEKLTQSEKLKQKFCSFM